MSQNDFYEFKTFTNKTNWTKNVEKEKVFISKIREVYVNNNELNKIYYKYFFENDYKEIILYNLDSKSIAIGTRRGKKSVAPFGNGKMYELYTEPLAFDPAKKNGLISLCKKNLS